MLISTYLGCTVSSISCIHNMITLIIGIHTSAKYSGMRFRVCFVLKFELQRREGERREGMQISKQSRQNLSYQNILHLCACFCRGHYHHVLHEYVYSFLNFLYSQHDNININNRYTTWPFCRGHHHHVLPGDPQQRSQPLHLHRLQQGAPQAAPQTLPLPLEVWFRGVPRGKKVVDRNGIKKSSGCVPHLGYGMSFVTSRAFLKTPTLFIG